MTPLRLQTQLPQVRPDRGRPAGMQALPSQSPPQTAPCAAPAASAAPPGLPAACDSQRNIMDGQLTRRHNKGYRAIMSGHSSGLDMLWTKPTPNPVRSHANTHCTARDAPRGGDCQPQQHLRLEAPMQRAATRIWPARAISGSVMRLALCCLQHSRHTDGVKSAGNLLCAPVM